MSYTISTDLFEENLQLIQDSIQIDATAFIQEDLYLLFIEFQRQQTNTYVLEQELLQLSSISINLQISDYSFIDEWSIPFFERYDITTANKCRGLISLLFADFLSSNFFRCLCHRFKKAKPDLLNQIDTIKLLNWMILWATRDYPQMALFLLGMGKEKMRQFELIQSIKLEQICYFLPKFMLWDIISLLNNITHRYLLAELANGKHIRKAEGCPFPFNKKMAHYFVNAPRGFNFDDAVWYGIIFGSRGNKQLLTAFQNHFKNWQQNPALLKTLLLFFTNAGKEAIKEEIPQLLGYLQHLWDENKKLILKGWTLASLRRRTAQWYEDINRRQLARIKQYGQVVSWKGANYRPLEIKVEEQNYQIVQLTSSEALQKESLALKHCVSLYTGKCVNNSASIWSLQQLKNEVSISLVTIEINNNRKIVQAKGLMNANPSKRASAIIKMWAKREKLIY